MRNVPAMRDALLARGRIVRGVGGLYSVESYTLQDGCDAGQQTGPPAGQPTSQLFLCPARGIFRKNAVTPLVGDEVDFDIDPIRPGYGSVVNILIRRSELSRPPVANVDQLLIVLTLSIPAPDFMLADKLIIQALSSGITPKLCFNKSDLPSVGEYAYEEEGYRRAGFTAMRVSRFDPASLGALEQVLAGKVTILAGQSGAGKSTLFNGFIGGMQQQAGVGKSANIGGGNSAEVGSKYADSGYMSVGDMSSRIGRGRHTTRHVELRRLKAGGWIVDSPGFSLYESEMGNYREADRFYPEYEPYIGMCKFKECSHIHEPGCAVLDALRKGDLHPGRHRRYAVLYKAYQQADSRKYSK